jgi:hypothetical protein
MVFERLFDTTIAMTSTIALFSIFSTSTIGLK